MVFQFKIKKQFRLPGYDYSSDGYYFITICIKDGSHYFGEVIEGRMRLSAIGKIAKRNWKRISKRYPNVRLDRFIIMPNHIHGIVIIDNKNAPRRRNAPRRVRTEEARRVRTIHENRFGSLINNSLPSIINHYKGAVKKECNKKGFEYFFWQARYYDHIIRNEKSLSEIQKYIINNPIKWETDKNY